MKLWKRNAVVAVIVLFVCVAVYLNWSYNSKSGDVDANAAATGKLLGEATLVTGETKDPLVSTGGTPGEVVTDTYFASARLNRQQARDSALTLLQQAVSSADATQTVKDEANVSIQTMANATLCEAQIENLVTAKGYADCMAFLGEESASVVVSALEGGLTQADTAKITEIVMEETGLSADGIKIIPAE